MPQMLVEECARFSLAMARRQLGRPALLAAYHRGQAIAWPGVPVPIPLAADTVYLPWRGSVSDPGAYTVRLRLQCPRCGRRVLVLYGGVPAMGHPPLGCRRCLGLIYYSQHGHGNRWYEQVVKPLRRVKRLDRRLAGRLRADVRSRLEREKAQLLTTIMAWQQRLPPPRRPPRRSGTRPPPDDGSRTAPTARKRPYRSLQYV